MTDPMRTPERFRELAEAYGGAIDRWPANEQLPARARLAADRSLAQVLGEAAALDALLDAAPEPMFSGVLRERLISEARKARPRTSPAVRWLSGAGLAAACLVGVVTGAHYSDRLIGEQPAATTADSTSHTTTAFDSQSDVLSFGEAG
jgi:hypothetical protein